MAALFKNGIIADNVGDSLSDYDAFISAMEGLKEKSSVQKHGVQLVESELNALQMEYSKLGVFQVSAKKELKVAIDPIDEDSATILEQAGYTIINSNDFDINVLKIN